jgi:predicted MFS family arabinose efflux permease
MLAEPGALAVVFAGLCTFLDLYATQALLPMLTRDFGATPADVSLTVTATTFAVALIAPFIGAVSDALGRKRLIVAAMFALVLPTIMIARVDGLGAMVFWRFVQGLLLPPIFAVTVAYVGEEWPPARATTVTGIYVAATAFGGFLSRFLSGLIAEHLGWRPAFLVLAAITLVCAAAVAWLMPRERHFIRSGGLLASGRFMLGHLANPQLVATFGVGFGVLFSFIAVFTYIDFVLVAPPFELSTAALGSIFVVYLIGLWIAPLTGILVRRLGRRRLVALAIGLWICALLLTFGKSLMLILAALTICAACGFVCQSCATSYVAISARQARSSAVGLYVTFYYVGGSAGGVTAGFAWNLAGWPGCVAAVAVVLALIAALVLRFWREANV